MGCGGTESGHLRRSAPLERELEALSALLRASDDTARLIARPFWRSGVASSVVAMIRAASPSVKLAAHVDELLLGCTRTARDRLALLVLLDCGVRRAELGGTHPRLRSRPPAAYRLRQGSEGARHPASRPDRHGPEGVPRRAARLRRPPTRAGRLPPLPREAHARPPRLLGRREEAARAEHGPPLVVPRARAGWPRRPRRPVWAQHAPRPAHLRDRTAPRRRGRGRIASARAQRPVHDGIYGHQDQRDLEHAMDAFAEAREAEETASRGNDSSSRRD